MKSFLSTTAFVLASGLCISAAEAGPSQRGVTLVLSASVLSLTGLVLFVWEKMK